MAGAQTAFGSSSNYQVKGREGQVASDISTPRRGATKHHAWKSEAS